MVLLTRVETEHGGILYKMERGKWFRGSATPMVPASGRTPWTLIPQTEYIPPEVLEVVRRLAGEGRPGWPAGLYELVKVEDREATGADKSRAEIVSEIRRRQTQLFRAADGCEIGMSYCRTAHEDQIRAQIKMLQDILNWSEGGA